MVYNFCRLSVKAWKFMLHEAQWWPTHMCCRTPFYSSKYLKIYFLYLYYF
jgi:hypothetical protein